MPFAQRAVAANCVQSIKEKAKEFFFLSPQRQSAEIEKEVAKLRKLAEQQTWKLDIDPIVIPESLQSKARVFRDRQQRFRVQFSINSENIQDLQELKSFARLNPHLVYLFEARPKKDKLLGNIAGHQAIAYYDPVSDNLQFINVKALGGEGLIANKLSSRVKFESLEEFAADSLSGQRPGYMAILQLSEQEINLLKSISEIRYSDLEKQNPFHIARNNSAVASVGIFCEATNTHILKLVGILPHFNRLMLEHFSERSVGKIAINMTLEESNKNYLVKIFDNQAFSKLLIPASALIYTIFHPIIDLQQYEAVQFSMDQKILNIEDSHFFALHVSYAARAALYSKTPTQICQNLDRYYKNTSTMNQYMMLAQLPPDVIASNGFSLCREDQQHSDQMFHLIRFYLLRILESETFSTTSNFYDLLDKAFP